MTSSLQLRETEAPLTPEDRFRPPTLRGAVLAHKRITAAAVLLLAALTAFVIVSALGSRVTRISDTTPCSVWGSAPQNQRDAYAALYVKQHGLLPSGASDAPTIEGVIDNGCTMAYGFDEADTVTVLQAIRHEY